MKILIISSGFFPVTELQGGAIEKLIENYLDYNETVGDSITVYSVKSEKNRYDKKRYKYTNFRIIDKTKLNFKLKRAWCGVLNKISKKYVPNAYIREVVADLFERNEINYFNKIIFENGQDFIPYFKSVTNTNSPIVLHLHNDYLNKDTQNGRDILKCCDEVWAVSKYIKKQVEQLINTPSDKVKVLYNTIDFSMFNKIMSEREKKKLREKLGIKDDIVFIYVGRIMQPKGVAELVEAFNEFSKNKSNVKLLIVGGSRTLENVDPYIKEVRDLAQYNNNIIFTGFINTVELYKYYQIADVQFVPSLWGEPFGLIVLEGIASKLPIIASNVGGIPEILGEDGNYVERNSLIKDLKFNMEQYLIHQEKFNVNLKNYKQIISKFSMEHYCETFKKFLNKRID